MDCATFLTKTSLALPRYRAIMGPFRWSVWLALLLTYLFAIFPLAFSHRHTLRHLLTNPGEIENMFWYVFGTFTNCFTFSSKESWSGTNKNATRMFIGWYWVFSIIITACYTGSIIAFVTLPVFPAVVDTPRQLLEGGYMIGALGNGDWQRWYNNSNEPLVNKLLYKMEYLTDVLDGLNNVIKSYNVPYAFLGSKDLMDYTIRSNFTGRPSKHTRGVLLTVQTSFKISGNHGRSRITTAPLAQKYSQNSLTRVACLPPKTHKTPNSGDPGHNACPLKLTKLQTRVTQVIMPVP
uniref:Ionotropic glutamate receptor C-terminal domain-containing protein n=1 Tax=Timema shepardi TaxID=629360 RepID=A0A7R9G4A1_TIMSH|nr:unnamed protein product [Timema shepardi]